MVKFGICTLAIGAVVVGATGIASTPKGVKRTNVNGIAWYDSFADAKAAAKRENKPILLLSMFGRIDEEMPCANARTLRATLFKDPDFKDLVDNDVIATWEMVRAVPKVTIDLGDGKKVQRTVRGNAVMYLCRPDGRVVDAYPGVYTSSDFFPMIRESISELANADPNAVLSYHKARGKMVPVTAITTGKAMVESPTLDLLGAKTTAGAKSGTTSTDPAKRTFLRAASRLRDMSLTPMTPEEAVNAITGSSARGKDKAELAREILQSDSTRNMTATRPVVHLWMASLKQLPTPAEARDAVLETILKIPYKDPYFGLKDVLLPGTP